MPASQLDLASVTPTRPHSSTRCTTMPPRAPMNVSLTVTDEDGQTSTITRQAVATEPAVTSLSCVDPSAPGGFVSCKLTLTEPAGYKVVLQSTSCVAHGNLFRVTEPVVDTLTTDGCYQQAGAQTPGSGRFRPVRRSAPKWSLQCCRTHRA